MAYSREIIKKVLQYVRFRVSKTEDKNSYYAEIGHTLVRISNHCTRLRVWDEILEKNPKWKGKPIISIVFEDNKSTFDEVDCLVLKRFRMKPIKLTEYVYLLQGDSQFITPQDERLIIKGITQIQGGKYTDLTNKCSEPILRVSQNPPSVPPNNQELNTEQYMNKKLIRLTEGDLHRIVENSVRRILRENNVPVGKYDGADLGDVHPYYAQYPKKKAEELASWDTYDRANDRYPYNGRPIRSNGYWEKFEKPNIEHDMYRSIGNASQYDTLAEPDDYARNDSGYGHHVTPTRPNHAQGRLAMAALNTDNDDPVYNSNGQERYGAVPSMARNPKYFSNGKERVNIGKLQGDRAAREAEDTWNAERPLRDIGA